MRESRVTGAAIRVSISTQTGGEFSGLLTVQGSGAATDPLCANIETTMTGHMTPDGTLTSLRFDPVFRSGMCTHVSGDEHFTGVITDGTRLRAERRDRVECRNLGGHVYEGDRTTTPTSRVPAAAAEKACARSNRRDLAALQQQRIDDSY
jgi:hypothetical protein